MMKDIWQVIRREIRIFRARPVYILASVGVMIFNTVFYLTFMQDGLPHDLPVGIVDCDRSSTSRSFCQQLDATQLSRVVYYDDIHRARRDMQTGRLTAFIVIPEGFNDDVQASRQPHLGYYVNSLYFVGGALSYANVLQMVNLTNGAVQRQFLRARGVNEAEILARIQPIVLDAHQIGNTTTNYGVYLNSVILPGVLEMIVILITVYAVGSELKYGTSRHLMETAGGSLPKALAGKIAGASLSMSTQRTVVSGSSTPGDVETMMQLVYLYMTANIKKDQESVDQLLRSAEVQLKNRLLNPEAVFGDSLNATMSRHNPWFKSLEVADLKQVNYDRILQMAKERTQNAAAFTFTIIGNYNDSTIRPLIEQYIASLPAEKKVVKGKDISTDYTGKVVNDFKHKAETPKSIAVLHWYTKKVPYTLENVIRSQIAGQVLEMVYLKEIREEASAAYNVSAQAGVSRDDFGDEASIYAYCPMKPEKADTAVYIMRRAVKDMAAGKCDADMLQKVKEYMLKAHGDQLKQNGYWAGRIGAWRKWGLDFHTDYEKTVQAVTPQGVCQFVADVLKSGNEAEVVMLPAE